VTLEAPTAPTPAPNLPTGPVVIGLDPNGCPSAPGYQRHQRRGEKPCDGCRDARNAARRASRADKPNPVKPDTTGTRFWSKVAGGSVDTCWEWQAYRDLNGYGRFSRGRGNMAMAHRVAYELMRAEIPEGLHLDHLCRNRACVNPWHLEPVTCLVNSRRGIAGNVNRTRQRSITHCPKDHPYDAHNTSIRTNGARRCKTCEREAMRRRYEANPEKYRAQARERRRSS